MEINDFGSSSACTGLCNYAYYVTSTRQVGTLTYSDEKRIVGFCEAYLGRRASSSWIIHFWMHWPLLFAMKRLR